MLTLLSASTDDGKDDTEGEEFKKARELRREEVRLQPLPVNLPTDTETEVSLVEIFSFGYGKTNVLFSSLLLLYLISLYSLMISHTISH